MNVKELEDRILNAAEAYYTTGNPIFSDDEFDELISQLTKLDPGNKILKTPGWGFIPKRNKKEHLYGIVGSLVKTKDLLVLAEPNKVKLPKLDGLSICIVYNLGIFQYALTRGNGEIGIDISHHVSQIVPATIDCKDEVMIRGEAVIRKDVFRNKYSIAALGPEDGKSNERNFVSGVLNRLTITEDIFDIMIVCYSVYNKDFDTKMNMLEFIEDQELIIPERMPDDCEDAEGWMLDREYLCDGLVVTDNNTADGENSIAFKFESERKTALIDRLEWSTGSTGAICPVAILETPIELAGASVTRATCHNARNIIEKGIDKGAVVEITRSNEVIPYITDVIKPVQPEWPLTCPTCGGETELEEVFLKCNNISCPARTEAAIMKFTEICDLPEGLASTTIFKYLAEFPMLGSTTEVKELHDYVIFLNQIKLSSNRLDDLVRQFKDHYGNLLYKLEVNIKRKLESGITPKEFWYSSNLAGLGDRMSKKLSSVKPADFRQMMQDDVEEADKKLEDIGVHSNVRDSILSNERVWCKLIPCFNIVEGEEVSDLDFQIAITGKISIPRGKFTQALDKVGISVGGISKKTKYLVCDKPSNSGKFKDAKTHGTEVITETDFLDMLKDIGINLDL